MSRRQNAKASNIKSSEGEIDNGMENHGDHQPLIAKASSSSRASGNAASQPQSGWKLALCFGGIFFSYLVFGILQEKITRGKYENDDRFTFIFMLVFIQCVVNTLVAKAILISKRGSARDFAVDHTPTWLYCCAGLSYVFAMVSSNKALAYISYPTQVIGKACKPIAVLILGIFYAKKSYGWKKFGCILVIVVGVAMFMYRGITIN